MRPIHDPMNDLSGQNCHRPGRYAILYLFTLLTLLSVLALWPRISELLDANWLPQIKNAQDVVSFFSIIMVACFGITVLVLKSRFEVLETARGVDNHAALHDSLTGAANRRQFAIRLEQLLEDREPSHTLLMIDLDRFKPINDLYGHAAGDAMLREITLGIKRLVHHDDLLARLGGDEFAMLLTDKSADRAEQTALEVLRFVTKYRLTWEGQRLSVGASIGLVYINRPDFTPAALLAASDEALYAAKEAGRGAIYVAELDADSDQLMTFRRVNSELNETFPSERSHVPEDGRKQELCALLMANLTSEDEGDRRRPHGARRRHEVRHWVNIEPKTISDGITPGMLMRELITDATARNDGGADFARWVMAMALDAASRLSPAALGRINFVLPVPARAFVMVPDLADELMRSNALARLPIRHITFILHGVANVYDSPILKEVYQRFTDRDIRMGYEIRADNLEVLAPLRHIPFAEIHLGRELIKKLRPGSSDNATLDALLAVVDKTRTTLVAACVESKEEVNLLTKMGIKRFTGPVIGSAKPLHEVLAGLIESSDHAL